VAVCGVCEDRQAFPIKHPLRPLPFAVWPRKGFNTMLSLGFTCVAVFACLFRDFIRQKYLFIFPTGMCVRNRYDIPDRKRGTTKKRLALVLAASAESLYAGCSRSSWTERLRSPVY
jgi:hypothetical protein